MCICDNHMTLHVNSDFKIFTFALLTFSFQFYYIIKHYNIITITSKQCFLFDANIVKILYKANKVNSKINICFAINKLSNSKFSPYLNFVFTLLPALLLIASYKCSPTTSLRAYFVSCTTWSISPHWVIGI